MNLLPKHIPGTVILALLLPLSYVFVLSNIYGQFDFYSLPFSLANITGSLFIKRGSMIIFIIASIYVTYIFAVDGLNMFFPNRMNNYLYRYLLFYFILPLPVITSTCIYFILKFSLFACLAILIPFLTNPILFLLFAFINNKSKPLSNSEKIKKQYTVELSQNKIMDDLPDDKSKEVRFYLVLMAQIVIGLYQIGYITSHFKNDYEIINGDVSKVAVFYTENFIITAPIHNPLRTFSLVDYKDIKTLSYCKAHYYRK